MTIDCKRVATITRSIRSVQKDYYKLLAFLHGINHYRGGGPTDVRPIGDPKQMEASFKKVEAELESETCADAGRADR